MFFDRSNVLLPIRQSSGRGISVSRLGNFFFQQGDLAQPAQVSFGLTIFGCQEGLYEVPSNRRAYGSATHTKDVHVIILDSLLG